MSSFAMVLLEGGLDMEVEVDFAGMTSLLDQEVGGYSCGDYLYRVGAGKGTIGDRWIFMVNAVDLEMEGRPLISLGRFEIEPTDHDLVHLSIPPRMEQAMSGPDAADWDGRLFGSFVFQLLNSLQARQMINLPGVLPTY